VTTVPTALEGHYDYVRVVLSVLLAMMGSYSALELAERVTAASGHARAWWLAGGAFATGVGVWSMHFMGMFAFLLPIPVAYDWPIALLSFGASVFGGGVALFVVSRTRLGAVRAIFGGIAMGGIGISVQHYSAMASMRMEARHEYSLPLVTLSVVVAIALAVPSLWLMFVLRENNEPYSARKLGSAALLGTAIPAMHYTAMAAVRFFPGPETCDPSHAVGVSTLGLVALVAANICVVGAVGLTSTADRLRDQRALLDELFDQSPEPVALLDLQERVVRTHREFSRVFGYPAAEAAGRSMRELIGREGGGAEDENYARLAAQGRRVAAEGILRRKDGTTLQVEMLHVPVTLARRRILVYAIFRDVTASKRTADTLRETNQQLQTLSRRIFRVQEEERRHFARELHDEVGQALTAAKINLLSSQAAADSAEVRRRIDDTLSILDQLLQQTRRLSLDLRPPLLDDLGLVPALRWYLDQQAQRTGIAIEFFGDPALERSSGEIETACFRIAQEAVTNAVRHAQTPRILVELRRTSGALHLVVRDEGSGFDVPAALRNLERSGNLGLLGMRERASLLGAELDLKSVLGRGTEVHAFFSLPDRPPAPEPTV
jgi:PAS domain S-box-containing protein